MICGSKMATGALRKKEGGICGKDIAICFQFIIAKSGEILEVC